MSGLDGFGQSPHDIADMTNRTATLLEKSRHLVSEFWTRQFMTATGAEFQFVDPFAVGRAFAELGANWFTDPTKFGQAFQRLTEQNFALMEQTFKRMQGQTAKPVVEPTMGDRRFKDPAWSENFFFDYLKQSYLITSNFVTGVVGDIDNLDRETRAKLEFYTRQFLSAASPGNFAFTNPQVIKKIQETGGENLVHGLENLLRDLERGRGQLKISMTDESAFEVGKNIATTPGKVVYQNDLIQLIQYAPTTKTVYRRPLIVVPPWINKFYVLDLQPKNSLIKWAVDRGHTVFVISWVNPRKSLAHKSFEDYMMEGPVAAIDAVEKATGERDVNVLGFCIGGILMVATLAYFAAKKDNRIKSATLLATMVDLENIGETSVFVDETQLSAMEKHMKSQGFLEGRHMNNMFSLLREKDLIWSFVINNYLLGKEPMPFDLLYWNSDSTRLPAAMLLFYLRQIYLKNALMKPNQLVLDGVPIDIGKIKTPCYFLATQDDHIAPWTSSFPAIHMLSGPVKFVLGGSGHIAGIVNPPGAGKYWHWTNPKKPPTPEAWLEGAKRHEGSWWPDWNRWLVRRGGKRMPARKPGAGKLKPVEDAPGTYVKVRTVD